MKIKQSPRQRAMALICVIIVVAAILIVAGTIVYMLIKLCKKILPPPGSGGTNNIVEVITFDNVNNFAEDGPITLPALTFPELAAPTGKTDEKPFGNGWLEIERTTNLVNWETILVITNPAYTFLLEDDTNPPPAAAFYRGKFVYP